jgi:hypothetical protein
MPQEQEVYIYIEQAEEYGTTDNVNSFNPGAYDKGLVPYSKDTGPREKDLPIVLIRGWNCF